jgi:16S rRNA (cytosine1402-N4)-methyltransferase
VTQPLPPSDAAVRQPHVPVLLDEVLHALAPRAGETYIDGTFGAGGYSSAILEAADCRVIGIDRDDTAIAAGQVLVERYSGRLALVPGTFSDLADIAGDAPVHGIVLDIGVSSMQIDAAARGFSFLRDGPLDMRMGQTGATAADIVNRADPTDLANIIYVFGEEPRSRAIAKAIVRAREAASITTTFELVKAVEAATGPQRAKDRTHPATRTFQALRIYVNSELDELAQALHAAEQVLQEGGRLVVVTFHSLEDRIVKRFFAQRSGNVPSQSRHVLGVEQRPDPSFRLIQKGHVEPTEAEMDRNPRSRSAKLRFGIRTAAKAMAQDDAALGVPRLGARRH